ncbi:MAG: 3-deoxy-manno-octulosonate cytidylyltransferase [bacterium]
MKIAAIIPARYQSSRFPGKPLADINGWPMIRHVYERTKQAKHPDRVIVATDDERIKRAVEDFGGEAVMTSPEHGSGTDRLAEAAERLEAGVIINVQGDEPLIRPEMIDQAVEPLVSDSSVEIATLKSRITDDAEINDPNVVKVVTDEENNALYFSRWPVPYNRQGAEDVNYYKHIGLYVYRKEILLKISRWKPTGLEVCECLEQLRVLEHGHKIRVRETRYSSWGVDVPVDLEAIKQKLE